MGSNYIQGKNMTTNSRTTFTAIGFVAVAVIAGACGYMYSHAQTAQAGTSVFASTSTPQAAAKNMVATLAGANWTRQAFTQYETTNLQAWLSKPENAKTLQKGLKNVGSLKGSLTVAEAKTESKNGLQSAFIVLTGDFAKGKQFINVAMQKTGSSWKINNLSVVSQDRVFAERSYIVGAEVLNKLSKTDWSTGTLNQFATPSLKKVENNTKVQAALSALTKLGSVQRVNQMLRFHFDAKTQTADLLMDVQFTKERRPVLMVMKLNKNHWGLDGISVMNYKETNKTAKHDSTASTTPAQKTA